MQVVAATRLDGLGLLAFACYAGVSLLVAAALYYGVERPFLQLRERRDVARQSPSPVAVAEG